MITFPLSASRSAQWFILAPGLCIWLWLAGVLLTRAIDAPSKAAVALCAAFILAPAIALAVRRLPVYLFAVYAAIVPFNDILVTNTGATVGKYLGIAVAGVILASLLTFAKALHPSRSLAMLAALMVCAGLTVFWSIDMDLALKSYVELLTFALFYGLVGLFPFGTKDLRLIIVSMLAGAVAACAYGDFLFSHGQQIAGDRLYIGYADQQSLDPNEFAATLVTPLAVALAYFLRSRAVVQKALFGCLLLMLFSGFAISGSRGALIGLSVMAAYILWRSKHRLQLLAILLPAAAGVAASPIGLRFMGSDVLTGDYRTELWKVGWAALHQYWLMGAGPGNYPIAYSQYYLTTWHLVAAWSRPAHSLLLQSAVEFGVVGLALVLALWYRVFSELRPWEGDDKLGEVCIGLSGAVAGLFAVGFSLDLMTSKYVWLTFSLVAVARSVLLTRTPAVVADYGNRTTPTALLAAEAHN